MPLPRLKGLKARLFTIVLLAMLPVLGIALFMAMEDHQAAKATALEDSRRLARAYAASGSALIERSRTSLVQAATLYNEMPEGDAGCAKVAAFLGSQSLDTCGFSITRPDGQPVCFLPRNSASAFAKQQDWQAEVLSTRSFVVGHYQHDPASGAAVLPMAQPLLGPDGAVRFVFQLSLNLDTLKNLLDDQALPSGAAVSIIDKHGTILARFPDDASAVGQSAPGADSFMSTLLSQGQDTWESEGVDGVRRLYFLTPLAGAEDRALFLRVGVPAELVFAVANRNLTRNLGFIGAMALVVLCSTWFFSNTLVLRHIEKLWLATRKLSEGNYAYRIGATGGGELGELALAFDHMAGVLEDRTARLSHAEASYREIFEKSVIGIMQATPEGTIMSANKAMASLLGYAEPEELISTVTDLGRDVYAVPGQRGEVLKRLDSEGIVSSLEFQARHASGDEVWLSMDARAIRGADGLVSYYEAMVSDITLRRRMEQELKAKQEKLQALLEYSPMLISIKDASGRYLLGNRRHQEVRGSGLPVVGLRVDEIFPAEAARQILDEDAQVLAQGLSMTSERTLHGPEGPRHYVTVKFPLYDESGKPDRVGSIAHDVTDMERVREALRQSEEKFRIMIQTSPDLIWFIDPQGLLLEVNSASRELIGYEPEELRGKHFHMFFTPEDLREHDRDHVLSRFLGGGPAALHPPKLINERRTAPRSTRNLNLCLIPKQGGSLDFSLRNFELSACGLWQDMAFMGTIVVIRDITERKRAEAALRQSQDLLKQTQAMARIGGWTLDLNTGARSWTDMAGKLLGREGGELPDFHRCQEFLAPEDCGPFRTALARAEKFGEAFDLELRLAHTGGLQSWVRFMGRRADADGARLLTGVIQDITHRKELEQLRADIDSIIRHDLKTPLNGIINLPQLIKDDENLNAAQREYLQFIEDCGRNMLRQIDMSLDLMKIERGQFLCAPAVCDLVPVLGEILGLLGDSARIKRVELAVVLGGQALAPGSAFLVWGEVRLCYPLLTNLMVNALEASPPGGRVLVSLEPGEVSRIAIHNQGSVPEAMRERFFEKYATSGKTMGTGLGTYSALLFAKAQNGWVELDASKPGATTLVVSLPRPPHLQ